MRSSMSKKRSDRIICGAIHRTTVGRLDHLKIPCRIFVPEQFVDGHQRFRNAEFAHQVVNLGSCALQLGLEPFYGFRGACGLLYVSYLPTLDQAERVPDLVAEIASLLAQRIIVHDIVTGGSGKHDTHTHTVGTVFGYQFQRIGRVAQRLRHLAAEFVTDYTGEIYVVEAACHLQIRNRL